MQQQRKDEEQQPERVFLPRLAAHFVASGPRQSTDGSSVRPGEGNWGRGIFRRRSSGGKFTYAGHRRGSYDGKQHQKSDK